MAQISHAAASLGMEMHASATHVLRRTIVIGLTAFLTVVDLFATQAILPSLTKAYHVTPAAMGLAVNASTLVGIGTFLAQATATGFVGRAATSDRASASGLYLACYFLGGLTGSAVLGQVFDRLGWAACVAGVGGALAAAALLAVRLKMPARATAA